MCKCRVQVFAHLSSLRFCRDRYTKVVANFWFRNIPSKDLAHPFWFANPLRINSAFSTVSFYNFPREIVFENSFKKINI